MTYYAGEKIRQVTSASHILTSLALLILLAFFPVIGHASTYNDVTNCLNANPAPDGCYNWTKTSTNSDGQTVYTVYQRCGHVLAKKIVYMRVIDPNRGGPCGWNGNFGENTCARHCLNSSGPGKTYYGYDYTDTYLTYCDGTQEYSWWLIRASPFGLSIIMTSLIV